MNIKHLLMPVLLGIASLCAVSMASAATPGEESGATADIVYGASTDPFPGERLTINETQPLGPQTAELPESGDIIQPDDTLIIKGVDIGAQASLGDEVGFIASLGEDTGIITSKACTDPGPQMDLIADGGPKAGKYPVGWQLAGNYPNGWGETKKPNLLIHADGTLVYAEGSGRHGKKPIPPSYERVGWSTTLVSLESDGGMKTDIPWPREDAGKI